MCAHHHLRPHLPLFFPLASLVCRPCQNPHDLHRGHTLASDLRDLLATYRARDARPPAHLTPYRPPSPSTSTSTTAALLSAEGATGLAALEALLPAGSALHEALASLSADGSFAVAAEVLRSFVDPAVPQRNTAAAADGVDADAGAATAMALTGTLPPPSQRAATLTNAQLSTMLWCLHAARGVPPRAPPDESAKDGAVFLRPRRRPTQPVPWPTFDGAGALNASEQVALPCYRCLT